MKEINKTIRLNQIKTDKNIYSQFLELLKNEYLNTFLTLEEFCKKYKISYKSVKFILDQEGLKKDMSEFNNFKRKDVKEKSRKTCKEKYGVCFSSQSPEVKNRKRENLLKKRGVSHISQDENIKKKKKETFNKNYPKDSPQYKELIEKRSKKRLENLGDYSEKVRKGRQKHQEKDPNFLENSNNLRVKTSLEKYGVSNVSQTLEVKKKVAKTRQKFIDTFEKENDCTQFKKINEKYGQGWKNILQDLTIYKSGHDAFVDNSCIHLIIDYYNREKETGISNEENEFYLYLQSIYKGEIIRNSRNIIPPLELDIYIPDLKIAIEFNGMYWHSTLKEKYKDYHLNKTIECEKRGIRLINIFEDLWKRKKEICKSIIKSALGIYDNIIYARQCVCKKISSKEYKDFLEENHLQGKVDSSLKLGLFYKNELVQIAGWGRSRFKKNEYELHRMCSKLNTFIVGGFSKLIKHSFLKKFISYIDRSVYTGSSYKKLGFTLIKETPPSYFYYSSKTGRINRISAQKKKLQKFLKNFDENLTESENMEFNGFLKIYDCGTLKMEYNIE